METVYLHKSTFWWFFLGREKGQFHNRGPNRSWLWPSWSIVGCSCILTEIPSGNWWTETNSEPEIRLIHHYDPKNAPAHLWKSVHLKLGTCLPWGFASASPAALTISKKKKAVYPENSQSFDLVAAMALLPLKTHIFTLKFNGWKMIHFPFWNGPRFGDFGVRFYGKVPDGSSPHEFDRPREYPKLHPGEIQILQLYPSANSTSPVSSNHQQGAFCGWIPIENDTALVFT